MFYFAILLLGEKILNCNAICVIKNIVREFHVLLLQVL